MRKLFLTLVTALLCNVVSFAQSGIIEISSAEDFLKIGKNGGYDAGSSFKQTADIDLGTFTQETAIIPTFSGTYDGNGYSITYQANFTAPEDNRKLGLFGTVSGTIMNLKLTNCSMTASSEGGATANIALLCAYLNGTITDCDVINGTINSTIATTGNFERVATGLIVGVLDDGWIKYSSATGSVVGFGYVGGLVGQSTGGDVYGSSFQGNVTATFVEDNIIGGIGGVILGSGRGSYAGGIVGMADNNSTINLCYVDASVVAKGGWTSADSGVGSAKQGGWMSGNGTPLVTNCYAAGTVGDPPQSIGSGDITNSANSGNKNNYYEGATVQNCPATNAEEKAECIAGKLNDLVPNEDKDKIQFSSDDDNVIFGVGIGENENRICGVPTNLVITNNAGNITASWDVATAGEGIIVANTWKYMLSGGDLTQVYHGTTTTNTTPSSTLPGSQNPYTLTVYTDCSATVNGLTSDAVSQTFTVPCPIPTNLQASNITDNGFTISWTASVDCQLTVNGNTYEILAGNDMTKQITGLEPETQYTAIVKAKCGNEYVEQASIKVTTARLSAPTGLTVTTGWNGSAGDDGGSATIEWATIDGLTYEVNTDGNTQTSPYQISNTLPQASYTAKVRAKKGDKYSDWASIPYTVSTPNAPSNPIVTYQHTAGEKFNVSISWTPGTEPNSGWRIELNAIFNRNAETNSCVITNQDAGSASIVQIIEKVGEHSTSKPLNVPIQVPCLPASEPTSIEPALNSVTFNFEVAKTRKIFIGSTPYDASATSVTIDGLTAGTSYAYEIREYCNVETNTYSSISSTFSTLACYAVAGLSVSNVELTTATVSWTSQSSIDDLNYKVVVNEEELDNQENPTAKTIDLTGLTQSTEYTVEVYEQCGAEGNWGAVSSITFTTKGTKNYISATSGDFTTGTTWIGGKAPNSADVDGTTITISQGHTLTLSSAFTINNKYTVTNNGVLVIQQGGELINTTSNNVGGIIEVVTPIKDQKNWHFVGAPFAGYKLEAIKPVNGSDVAITTFNYTTDQWHSSDTEGDEQWATYETWINKGEGYFAWQFYDGAMRFTTYGDLWVWDTPTTGHNGSYNFNQPPLYKLNNDDEITVTESGNWIALANPYPFKLKVATFLNDQTGVQGGVRYKYNNDNETFTTSTSGEIGVTEGFFVNFIGNVEHEVKFKKTQRDAPSAKANAEREFIRLALVQGKREVELLFAQNEDAEQGYDIYDANKLFSPMGVAEPYFVTDGIALIKEEVRDLPYYATMNVRSQEDTVMNFVLTNLPEGYAVSIIDGEEVIDLVEGGVYSTEIASGENADRFKVLVKKNVGLADVEELDVRITNSNRHITITAQENVRTEVYNTLGQKVFETEDTNFVLSGVASGAYVVKVQGAKASKSQKIVVE